MTDELLFSAKYCYNVLNLHKSGNTVERLSNTLFNSKIKLTPHQINAALFAFKSPFSKGSILADEVGLGKTIEAGIVITQFVYERKSKIIVVAPASLVRQWENELFDKFRLDCLVLDRKTYNSLRKKGYSNPFDNGKKIILCSYQMCSMFCDEIKKVGFNLVIIDEAHKLRNVYGEKAVTAKRILEAMADVKKLLLTATPIQNSLMDLYGLSQFIDPNIFGDKAFFKYNFIKNFNQNEHELDSRLHDFLYRTLRSQVNQYIKFTKRIPRTYTFNQTSQEKKVYDEIRDLLLNADKNIYIIPTRQRHLLLLILCKLMGSSMHAIVGTIEKIVKRLEQLIINGKFDEIDENLIEDIDDLEEYIDEDAGLAEENIINMDEVKREITLLINIINNAKKVQVESKYIALQNALLYSFQHLRELGAEEKVIIFTESRRTQDYLCSSLKKDGYEGVISFNGTNNDQESHKIYEEWISRDCNKDFIGRSNAVNLKAAILEKFEHNGRILIATEAGAEGLNLQFCSLVINYDLPWNPQRVEQRIGRCHRFGQLFDVVVINFLSADNIIEQRIYELLDSKFSLFSEVLGSSDDILGTVEKGDDLAQSIIEIYTKCRSNEEINEAFNELQEKYKEDIESSIKETKQVLLENFEEDLQQFFAEMMDSVNRNICEIERVFWKLTKSVLWGKATFNEDTFSFKFNEEVGNKCYSLRESSSNGICVPYGRTSDLGIKVFDYAKDIQSQYGEIIFDITNYPYRLSVINELKGKSGYILIKKLIISALEIEEYMVINGILCDGNRLDEDLCAKLFRLNTQEIETAPFSNRLTELLEEDTRLNISRKVKQSLESNNLHFNVQIEKINKWADDKIQATQLDVELMREERRLLQKNSELASNLVEKREIEEKILHLSKRIKQAWINLATNEEEIEENRKKMIADIKKINYGNQTDKFLFLVKFSVV